eukprot:sb/3460852/
MQNGDSCGYHGNDGNQVESCGYHGNGGDHEDSCGYHGNDGNHEDSCGYHGNDGYGHIRPESHRNKLVTLAAVTPSQGGTPLVTQFPLHCGHAKTCLTFATEGIVQQLTALQNPRDLARKGLHFLLQTVHECRTLKYTSEFYDLPTPTLAPDFYQLPLYPDYYTAFGITSPTSLAEEQMIHSQFLTSMIPDLIQLPPLVAPPPQQISYPVPREDQQLSSYPREDTTQQLSYPIDDDCQIVSSTTSTCGPIRPAKKRRSRRSPDSSCRHRTKFLPYQLEYLEVEFSKTPFAVSDRKEEIARNLGLPAKTVALWFQNRRLVEHEVVSCSHLAAGGSMEHSERFLECLEALNRGDTEEPTLLPLQPLFKVSLGENEDFRRTPLRVKSTPDQCSVVFTITNSAQLPIPDTTVVVKFDTDRETLNRSKSLVDEPVSPTDPSDGLSLISLRAETELQRKDQEGGARRSMLGSSQPTTLQPGVAIGLYFALRPSRNPTIKTSTAGTITGITNGNIWEFHNIKYAEDPVGDLRFAPPQAIVREFDEAVDGSNASSVMCVQGIRGEGMDAGDEECLVLSVRAPKNTKNGPLPIVVWIHGGGLYLGWNSQPGYFFSSSSTEKLNAVVVSINYRGTVFLLYIGCTALLAGVAIGLYFALRPSRNPTIKTSTAGTITGIANGNIWEFHNIKYAEDPVGDLRFAPPQAIVREFDEAVDGSNASSVMCVQGIRGEGMDAGDEECLVLSVRAPKNTKNGPLPIVVWIHGGGLYLGWNSQPGYFFSSSSTEKLNAVVVSINYRLRMRDYHLTLPTYPGIGYFDFPLRYADDTNISESIGLIFRDGDIIDLDTPHFTDNVFVSSLVEEVAFMVPQNDAIEASWEVAEPIIDSLLPALNTTDWRRRLECLSPSGMSLETNSTIWNRFVTDMRVTCPANNFATEYGFNRVLISHHLVSGNVSYPAIHAYDTYALFEWSTEGWYSYYLPTPTGAETELEGAMLDLLMSESDNKVLVSLDPRHAGSYGLHTLQIQILGHVTGYQHQPIRNQYFLIRSSCFVAGTDRNKSTANQNPLFRSRDWLSANQGPVFLFLIRLVPACCVMCSPQEMENFTAVFNTEPVPMELPWITEMVLNMVALTDHPEPEAPEFPGVPDGIDFVPPPAPLAMPGEMIVATQSMGNSSLNNSYNLTTATTAAAVDIATDEITVIFTVINVLFFVCFCPVNLKGMKLYLNILRHGHPFFGLLMAVQGLCILDLLVCFSEAVTLWVEVPLWVCRCQIGTSHTIHLAMSLAICSTCAYSSPQEMENFTAVFNTEPVPMELPWITEMVLNMVALTDHPEPEAPEFPGVPDGIDFVPPPAPLAMPGEMIVATQSMGNSSLNNSYNLTTATTAAAVDIATDEITVIFTGTMLVLVRSPRGDKSHNSLRKTTVTSHNFIRDPYNGVVDRDSLAVLFANGSLKKFSSYTAFTQSLLSQPDMATKQSVEEGIENIITDLKSRHPAQDEFIQGIAKVRHVLACPQCRGNCVTMLDIP